MTLCQYLCIDTIEYLNRKTRLAASTAAFWTLRIAIILLNLSGTHLLFVTQGLGYKKIFSEHSYYISFICLIGTFLLAAIVFVSLSIRYKVFLWRKDALLFVISRVALTSLLLLFPLFAKYEPLPSGGYKYEPIPTSWATIILVFFFVYLPSIGRFSKNIIVPLKEIRLELGKVNMTLYRYFNFSDLNYVNEKTTIVRSPASYRLFRFFAIMVSFTSIIVYALPRTLSFKRLFDTSDTHFYFYWYLISIGAFFVSVMAFLLLSLIYRVFSKKRIAFYFVVGYLISTSLMSLCSLYTIYTPLSKGKWVIKTNFFTFIFDVLIIIFYYAPAVESRFINGVRKPLKKLRKQFRNKKEAEGIER